MAMIKCKMCGGTVELSDDREMGTCKYCGSIMTFPKIERVQQTVVQVQTVTTSVGSGEGYVIMGFLSYETEQWDAAKRHFEQALVQDSTCAEAYLGLMLVSGGRSVYQEKWLQYMSENMSELEKKVFTARTQEAIYRIYCDLWLWGRMQEALEFWSGPISDECTSYAIRKWPQADVVELFADYGGNLNLRIDGDSGEECLLSYLTFECGLTAEVFELMLQRGANPNMERVLIEEKASSHYSLLYDCMVFQDNVELVRLLLDYGADVNYKVQDNTGGKYQKVTALAKAVWMNRTDLVELLLAHGAEPTYVETGFDEETGKYFEEPLLYQAVENNDVQMIRMLLEAGAEANSQGGGLGENRFSVLWRCINEGIDLEIVRLLIEHGADVNYVAEYYNDEGEVVRESVLANAMAQNDEAAVQMLLEYGAEKAWFENY